MRFEKNGNAKWVGVEMEVKSVIDIKIVIFSWSLWSNYNRLELLLLNDSNIVCNDIYNNNNIMVSR